MDTSQPKPGIAMPAKRGWRRHSAEFKARVIELAGQPQASVAAVALANGLNANMLRRWVREAEGPVGAQVLPAAMTMSGAPAMPAFMPLPMLQERPALPTLASPAPTDTTSAVFVELHRGDTSAYVSLPLNANSAAWLREVLT